jgi:hypothetical protein
MLGEREVAGLLVGSDETEALDVTTALRVAFLERDESAEPLLEFVADVDGDVTGDSDTIVDEEGVMLDVDDKLGATVLEKDATPLLDTLIRDDAEPVYVVDDEKNALDEAFKVDDTVREETALDERDGRADCVNDTVDDGHAVNDDDDDNDGEAVPERETECAPDAVGVLLGITVSLLLKDPRGLAEDDTVHVHDGMALRPVTPFGQHPLVQGYAAWPSKPPPGQKFWDGQVIGALDPNGQYEPAGQNILLSTEFSGFGQ